MIAKKRYSFRPSTDYLGSVWELVGLNGKRLFTFNSSSTCSSLVTVLNKELDLLDDDPSKDLVGAVRRSNNGEQVIRRNNAADGNGSKPWYVFDRMLEGWSAYRRDTDVQGWEILSPVEGSPAWQALQG